MTIMTLDSGPLSGPLWGAFFGPGLGPFWASCLGLFLLLQFGALSVLLVCFVSGWLVVKFICSTCVPWLAFHMVAFVFVFLCFVSGLWLEMCVRFLG